MLIVVRTPEHPPPWYSPREKEQAKDSLQVGHSVLWPETCKIAWLSRDLLDFLKPADCMDLDKLHSLPILKESLFEKYLRQGSAGALGKS